MFPGVRTKLTVSPLYLACKVILPCLTLGSFVCYIVFAFVAQPGRYTAAWWALMVALWGTPLTISLWMPYSSLTAKFKRTHISGKKHGEVYYFYSDTSGAQLDFLAFQPTPVSSTVKGKMTALVAVVGVIFGLLAGICNAIVQDAGGSVFAFITSILGVFLLMLAITAENDKTPSKLWNICGARVYRVYRVVFQVFSIFLIFLVTLIFILSSINSVLSAYNINHYKPLGVLYQVDNDNDNNNNGVLSMHLYCTGKGDPTILLFHGLGGQALDWSWVQPSVSNVTRVCSFDRMGYAWSDPGPGDRTSNTITDELEDLLTAGGMLAKNRMKQQRQRRQRGYEEGRGGVQIGDNKSSLDDDDDDDSEEDLPTADPATFILVGHSFAGFNMRVFRSRHTNIVKGMIMVDCVDPATTSPIGYNVSMEGVSSLMDLGRNILPSGIVWLLLNSGAMGNESPNMVWTQLPSNIHSQYLQNLLKPKYYQTRIDEYTVWPQSAQMANDTGKLGDLPLVVFAAGRGLNNTGLVHLSTNGTLIYLQDADHGLPFRSQYATMIVDEIFKMFYQLLLLHGQ
eukprot:TRINITY_DN5801_c0_g1_i1.p1 TRINITY_DN5801_c0_g1~~TRINITY_DN5801_c0_g1_i1.p1  ORF type:complete len:609 (-),score=78.88 TRINITY_DN5801_c0_g1_i1:64-1764(-)